MSIRKRITTGGETRWLVDYKDNAGARRFKQFATKREAEAFNIQARGEVTAGIHTADAASITVAEAADLWIARCERDQLEPATVYDYRAHLRLHILPFVGLTKLSRLTVPALNAFRDKLLDTGRSQDMAKRVMKSLSALIGEAQGRGLASVNNVRALVRVKRGKRTDVRPLMPTHDELRSIIAATPDSYRPLILTAIFTGLRGSELRGLAWRDIDFKRGELNVRQRADRYKTIGPPKSEAGIRTVPLSPLLLNTLKAWRLACPKGDLDLVFPDPDGGIESHAQILHRAVWPIQIKAGVTTTRNGVVKAKYSLHALRHAAAALWIEQGVAPKRIQSWMGHSSITMTLDVYGYLFPVDESDSAAMASIAAKLVD